MTQLNSPLEILWFSNSDYLAQGRIDQTASS